MAKSAARKWVDWVRKRIDALCNLPAIRPARSLPGRPPLPRLALPAEPAAIYAIGDVHGSLDQLRALERRIVADGARVDGLKLIVFLGDYVDRGPDSAGVLEHLVAPSPEGFRRVCLRGNHDDMMLRLLDGSVDPEWWLGFGGAETLQSYGLDSKGLAGNRRALNERVRRLKAEMPTSHRHFLAQLPVALSTPRYFFSHAGARPGVPLEAQSDEDLMWVRRPFLDHDGEPFEQTVVHGHTPARAAFVSRYRIGLDTNACRGGKLSAARLSGGDIKVLSV